MPQPAFTCPRSSPLVSGQSAAACPSAASSSPVWTLILHPNYVVGVQSHPLAILNCIYGAHIHHCHPALALLPRDKRPQL
ncbi:uncharacterized protein A1O5_03634 [Cladophialophora psammophila CBS 110553]|uniref:Uncharacterized protein n=1 Tax=Cladophialophora psammophila CBS 110553 TaxID=1182543 RepID=W9X099_9EURO|nr:uncharacterized protein A1O5_03634 [Cladophialophora psammophila CBS 110553]EXJ73872.1 hypothetical protein A1O5_03634 [Cladophialophora psammophila CBS 110553]